MILNQNFTKSYTEHVTIDSFSVTDSSRKLENFPKILLASNDKNNAVKFNEFSIHFRNPSDDKIELVSVNLKLKNETVNFKLNDSSLDTDCLGKSMLKIHTSLHENLNYLDICPIIKKSEINSFFEENSLARLFIKKIFLTFNSATTNTTFTYSCNVLVLSETLFKTKRSALYPFISQINEKATFIKYLNGTEMGNPSLNKKRKTPPLFELKLLPFPLQRKIHFQFPPSSLSRSTTNQIVDTLEFDYDMDINAAPLNSFLKMPPIEQNREFQEILQDSSKKMTLSEVPKQTIHMLSKDIDLDPSLNFFDTFPAANQIVDTLEFDYDTDINAAPLSSFLKMPPIEQNGEFQENSQDSSKKMTLSEVPKQTIHMLSKDIDLDPSLNFFDTFPAANQIVDTLEFDYDTGINAAPLSSFLKMPPIEQNGEFQENSQHLSKKRKLHAVSERTINAPSNGLDLDPSLHFFDRFSTFQEVENVSTRESQHSQIKLDAELNLIFEEIGRCLESNDF